MSELIQINDYLKHAPVGVVAMLFAIAIGYILKSAQFFPNRIIPAIVVPATAFIFTLIQFSLHILAAGAHPWEHVPLNFTLGFIYGTAAWILHAQLLKRFLDTHFFNDDGSTKFLNKPTKPNP